MPITVLARFHRIQLARFVFILHKLFYNLALLTDPSQS
jgi:hypothetical protein